jgi:hypothetical protein
MFAIERERKNGINITNIFSFSFEGKQEVEIKMADKKNEMI